MSKWLNICVDCGNQVVTRGAELPGECPKCRGWRWLCHLAGNNNGHRQHYSNKKINQKTDTSIFTPMSIMSTLKDTRKPAIRGKMRAARGDSGDNGHRGRPQTEVPEGLIKKLAKKGYGAKRITRHLLDQEGVAVSYRTVLRRLNNMRQ